jgi:SAM-dependent methyltransferase
MAQGSQAKARGGDEGQFFVAERLRIERMQRPLTSRLLAAASISPADSVLDIGCGCGEITCLAAQACRDALGVDLSAAVIAEAWRLARNADVRNVSFAEGDAQTWPFPTARFDIVLSSFGVMFFEDPPRAFTNIATALRPGGKIAFLCWQAPTLNEWISVPLSALNVRSPVPPASGPGPFSLADPDRIGNLLSDSGFQDISVVSLNEPVLIGSDVDDAIHYYRRTPFMCLLLDRLDESAEQSALKALGRAMQSYSDADGIKLASAAWLVTARKSVTDNSRVSR